MSAFETMQIYAMLASNVTQMWAVFLGVLAFLIGTVLFGSFDRAIRVFIYIGCCIGGALIFYGLWRHYQLLDQLVEVARAIPTGKDTAQTRLLTTIGYDRTLILWGTGILSVVMLAVAEFVLRPRRLP
jgi:hypothetical protein